MARGEGPHGVRDGLGDAVAGTLSHRAHALVETDVPEKQRNILRNTMHTLIEITQLDNRAIRNLLK